MPNQKTAVLIYEPTVAGNWRVVSFFLVKRLRCLPFSRISCKFATVGQGSMDVMHKWLQATGRWLKDLHYNVWALLFKRQKGGREKFQFPKRTFILIIVYKWVRSTSIKIVGPPWKEGKVNLRLTKKFINILFLIKLSKVGIWIPSF